MKSLSHMWKLMCLLGNFWKHLGYFLLQLLVTLEERDDERDIEEEASVREMVFVERVSYNTFYSFQNKNPTYWNLLSVRILSLLFFKKIVSNEMGYLVTLI